LKIFFTVIVVLGCFLLLSQEAACRDMAPENPISSGAPITLLDFANCSRSAISQAQQKELLAAGFAEIKCRFGKKGFSIFIEIRKGKFKFLFDTSFQNAFSMRFSQKIPFLKGPHQTVESASTDFIYNNKCITVNGIHYSSAITVSKSEKTSRVGMGFIKGFDWIIDSQNKKVYIRKNSIGLDSRNRFTLAYAAAISNNRLVIVSRNSRFRKYNIGDVISAVNGIEVTTENLQEMAALLSSTTDWELLALEITPIKSQ